MSSPSSRYLLRLATPADSQAIGRVLEDGGFPGHIAVQFTRRPDPYASYQHDGDEVVMPVAVDRESGEIVAVGGCVLRRAWLDGELRTVGYLTGMKIAEAHRRGRVPMREAYALLREQTRGRCAAYHTTILSGNRTAAALLEKPRRGMPRYRALGDYTVYCLGTGRRAGLGGGLRLERGARDIAAFYREQLPRWQLAPADEHLHGLRDEDFYTLRTPGGEILAACAVWNQQAYKQYRITGYNAALRLLRRLPTRRLGYPQLPGEGECADYASIALLAVRPEAHAHAAAFVRAVAAQAGRYQFLMLGLMDGHPLSEPVSRVRHIKYGSRVYAVQFEGDSGDSPDPSRMHLEVGLL